MYVCACDLQLLFLILKHYFNLYLYLYVCNCVIMLRLPRDTSPSARIFSPSLPSCRRIALVEAVGEARSTGGAGGAEAEGEAAASAGDSTSWTALHCTALLNTTG